MSWNYVLLALGLVGFAVVYGLLLRRQVSRRKPDFTIVVDGSNVMHWGGDASVNVLTRVLESLEGKGHTPAVFFDASVGYRLADRYYNEARIASVIGLPANQICVVHKGVVADEAILMFATDHNLRIVTNDQYRDWRVQFPHAAKKGRLVRGQWRDGSVIWSSKI